MYHRSLKSVSKNWKLFESYRGIKQYKKEQAPKYTDKQLDKIVDKGLYGAYFS